MIGGEAAELAAPARRPGAEGGRDPYELGRVVDWLYGDAALPLARDADPVPPARRRQPVPALADAPALPPEPRRRAPSRRRRARRLALV